MRRAHNAEYLPDDRDPTMVSILYEKKFQNS